MIFFSYLKTIVWSKSMLWLVVCIICLRIVWTQGLLSKTYPTLPDLWSLLFWVGITLAMYQIVNNYDAVSARIKRLNEILPIKRWLMKKCPALARISMETLVEADSMFIFWLEPKDKATSLVRIWENYARERKTLPDFVYWVTEHISIRNTEPPIDFIVRIASRKKVYLGFDQTKQRPYSCQWGLEIRSTAKYRHVWGYFKTTLNDGVMRREVGNETDPYMDWDPDDLWRALFIATNFKSIQHYDEIQKWLALTKFLAETKNGKIGSSPILGSLRETIMNSFISDDFTADEFLIALNRIELGKRKQKKPQALANVLGKISI